MNQLYVVARFKIHPGRQSDFKNAAAESLAAVRSGDTGTLAYEWFINEEQTDAIVLEAYESSQAVLVHMKSAGRHMPKLLKFGDPSADGLGTPSPELRNLLKDRITFLPRFQGLNAPTLADAGAGTDIRTIARFRIHPGKLDDFKSVAAAGLKIVAEQDQGTFAYEWYLDEAGAHCTVVEMYRDAAALLAHSKNVGHLVRTLLQASDLSVELCARGPAAALAPLAKLPMKRFGYFQGIRF
jgi:quinol monooxygenase YgiN